MAWARIDDGLHDHPKVLRLLDHPDGLTALGMWTACLSWAHRHTRGKGQRPGFIPLYLPRLFAGEGNKQLASLLVSVELWEEAREGEEGWLIHDFSMYLPSDDLRRKRAEAGRKGGLRSHGGGRPPKDSADVPPGETSNLPRKNKQTPGQVTVVDTGTDRTSVSVPERSDVERLCAQLADKITENGSARPTVTKQWRDAARLMIDKDGRTEEQIMRAIAWCQADEFWRGNILSMPKLRQRYDQLRLAAMRNGNGQAPHSPPVAVQRAQQALEAGRALAARRRGETDD